MKTDSELLDDYSERGAEEAFREVVRRYVDMVYAVALRVVGGDTHLAEDVSQRVITALARQARKLSRRATVAGWLQVSARYTAVEVVRRERRRKTREQEAETMKENPTTEEINWVQMRPVLDAAVAQLRDADRDAVVLRFFQGRSHREIGEALGLNENAARMRVERAVEKLRENFMRRGVTAPAALLAAVLSANPAQAAPAGLAAALSGQALAGAGSAGMISTLLHTLSMTTKTKMTLVTAVTIAALAAIPITYQRQEIQKLQKELGAERASPPRPGRGGYAKIGEPDGKARELTVAEIRAKVEALRGSGRNWRNEWQKFVDTLDPADIGKVVACLEEQISSYNLRASFLIPLLTLWAKTDAPGALAYLDGYPAGTLRDMEVAAVVEGWTDKDPGAAAEWWQKLPAGRLRADNAKAVIGALADKNPEAAYELTLSTTPRMQTGLIQDVFFLWGLNDPAGAMAQAAQMPVGQLRTLAIRDLAMGWSERDSQAALNWANTLPGGADKAIATGMAMQALAEKRPQEATDYVLSLPPGEERDGSIRGLTSVLANNDPKGAWSLVDQLPEGRGRQMAQSQIATQWAETDPKGAMEFAQNLPEATAQSLIAKIVNNWARIDPKAAVAQLENMPEGAVRDSYLSGLFNGLLTDFPREAAALVASLPADKQAAEADRVTFSLADVDPRAAVAWAATLPGGLPGEKSVKTIIDRWAPYDPVAAGQWIKTLPNGVVRDNAVQSYVNQLNKSYPAYAAPWAEAIADETARNAAIESVAQNWLSADPQAAAAWLAKSGLPAERQQKLLQGSAPRPNSIR